MLYQVPDQVESRAGFSIKYQPPELMRGNININKSKTEKAEAIKTRLPSTNPVPFLCPGEQRKMFLPRHPCERGAAAAASPSSAALGFTIPGYQGRRGVSLVPAAFIGTSQGCPGALPASAGLGRGLPGGQEGLTSLPAPSRADSSLRSWIGAPGLGPGEFLSGLGHLALDPRDLGDPCLDQGTWLWILELWGFLLGSEYLAWIPELWGMLGPAGCGPSSPQHLLPLGCSPWLFPVPPGTRGCSLAQPGWFLPGLVGFFVFPSIISVFLNF